MDLLMVIAFRVNTVLTSLIWLVRFPRMGIKKRLKKLTADATRVGSHAIYAGDCIEIMNQLEAESVDAIVCDPPYGLGFMGKKWDVVVPGVEWAQACLRVLKPGGHLVAFGGTRTIHRLACAVEDAGFEIRNATGAWIYFSGFPKSTRVNRSPMFCQCAVSERNDENTGPSPEPRVRSDMAAAGSGDGPLLADALHSPDTAIDCRGDCPQAYGSDGERLHDASGVVPASPPSPRCAPEHNRSHDSGDALDREASGIPSLAQCTIPRASTDCSRRSDCAASERHGNGPSTQRVRETATDSEQPAFRKRHTGETSLAYGELAPGFPRCQACGKPNANGFGTDTKPAMEPWVCARKPLSESTVAANVLKWGTGALNIDACRYGYGDPAWPGPGENTSGAVFSSSPAWAPGSAKGTDTRGDRVQYEDAGGRWPANIYACPKAARSEREAGCEDLEPLTQAEAVERTPGSAGASNPRAGANRERGPTAFGALVRVCNVCGNRSNAGPSRPWPTCGHGNFSWDAPSTASEPVRNHHPTVKPIKLMAWLCRLVTPPGGLVIDPFLGSGTTLLAAQEEGLRGIGIELAPEYVKIATARLQDATRQGRLF